MTSDFRGAVWIIQAGIPSAPRMTIRSPVELRPRSRAGRLLGAGSGGAFEVAGDTLVRKAVVPWCAPRQYIRFK